MTEVEIALENALDDIKATLEHAKDALGESTRVHESVLNVRVEILKVSGSESDRLMINALANEAALVKCGFESGVARLEWLYNRVNALPLSYYVGVSRP